MPPFGTHLVDDSAVQLVRGWIETLQPSSRIPAAVVER
jgi:hypothetical protein